MRCIKYCFRKSKKWLLKRWMPIWNKVSNKSLQFEDWKKRKKSKFLYQSRKALLKYSKEYFEFRSEVEEAFAIVKTKNHSAKALVYKLYIFTIPLIILYFLNENFSIINTQDKSLLEKITLPVAYSGCTLFILDGVIVSLSNLIIFRYSSNIRRCGYLIYQLLKSTIYATSSYVVMLVTVYKLCEIYERAITEIREISAKIPFLESVINIIDKHPAIKTLIVWFIACTLMFVIYRLYVPVFKKTGEILQFRLNYKFKYEAVSSKIRVSWYFVLLMTICTSLGIIWSTSTTEEQVNAGFIRIVIGYICNLVAVFIIEYKIEKELRIGNVKLERS